MQGNGKSTPTAPAACIDAETLAAWADGGLTKGEAAVVEVHLADCERCTSMLATFARTLPAAPATESLWKRWHLRWLVPIATAATVVSLYVLIPRQPPAQFATETSAPTAEAKSEALTGTLAVPQPAPPQAAQTREAKEQDTGPWLERSRRPQEQEKSADEKRADAAANAALRGSVTETVQIPPTAARELERAEGKLADAQKSEGFSPPVTAATPTPASPPVPAAAAPAPASPPASAAAAPPPAADASAFRANNAARARAPLASTVAESATTTTMFEVRSPNPMTRWRVVGAGLVERSTNGGAQWQRATLPESATLTGGSSPSPSICWLVGRSGSIYVTTNGLRFTRVAFVDRIDFVSIQAIDARRATVVTIDGRTMRTEDQGATWVRVAP